MVGKMARSISPWWHGVVNGILPSNTNCAHASALHWSTTWTQHDKSSALGLLEYPLNGYVSGCIQRQAFVTFKHSHQGHTKKPKISGRPNRRFFSSLGYCVRISRHWRALFQNGQISLLWYGAVNRILPSNAYFAGASALYWSTA